MNKIDLVEKPRLRDDLPDFRPGDTVKVHARVVEAGRERIQVFQGVVIRRQGGGLRETFTVSPGLKSGRSSRRRGFSTRSILFMVKGPETGP